MYAVPLVARVTGTGERSVGVGALCVGSTVVASTGCAFIHVFTRWGIPIAFGTSRDSRLLVTVFTRKGMRATTHGALATASCWGNVGRDKVRSTRIGVARWGIPIAFGTSRDSGRRETSGTIERMGVATQSVFATASCWVNMGGDKVRCARIGVARWGIPGTFRAGRFAGRRETGRTIECNGGTTHGVFAAAFCWGNVGRDKVRRTRIW